MLKYQALAEQLRTGIEGGAYPPGDKLPSENELVASSGLSRQTVRQALALLEQEGRIERRRGSGSVVLGSAAHRAPTRFVAVITTYIGEYIFPELLRGMEEVLACREAGVPVDVIPGVTSAVAAPALASAPGRPCRPRSSAARCPWSK